MTRRQFIVVAFLASLFGVLAGYGLAILIALNEPVQFSIFYSLFLLGLVCIAFYLNRRIS